MKKIAIANEKNRTKKPYIQCRTYTNVLSKTSTSFIFFYTFNTSIT